MRYVCEWALKLYADAARDAALALPRKRYAHERVQMPEWIARWREEDKESGFTRCQRSKVEEKVYKDAEQTLRLWDRVRRDAPNISQIASEVICPGAAADEFAASQFGLPRAAEIRGLEKQLATAIDRIHAQPDTIGNCP